MKLKVICQICGKVEVIDTTKAGDWQFLKLTDLLDIDLLDWEVWFCGSCWLRLEERKEQGTFQEFINNLFRPTSEELLYCECQ